MPGPCKRKKEQAEEEPKGMPGRSLRRTKPDHESIAPKVGGRGLRFHGSRWGATWDIWEKGTGTWVAVTNVGPSPP